MAICNSESQVYDPIGLRGAAKIGATFFATGAMPNPIGMVVAFIKFVTINWISGKKATQAIENYIAQKTEFVKTAYKNIVLPASFISIPPGKINFGINYSNIQGQKQTNEYWETCLWVPDIFPFTLVQYCKVPIYSFPGKDSKNSGTLSFARPYFLNPNDGIYYPIDTTNNLSCDRPQPGILLGFILNPKNISTNKQWYVGCDDQYEPYIDETQIQPETGQAYLLAPGVQPNFWTDTQAQYMAYNKLYNTALLIILTIIILYLLT